MPTARGPATNRLTHESTDRQRFPPCGRSAGLTAALARVALAAVPALGLAAAVGCGGEPTGTSDGGEAEPRTYRMGFFANGPRPDEESIVTALVSMSGVAEVVLIQEPPPWPRILAGEPLEDLAAEKTELAAFLRSLGLEVAYLADPLDGLDRTSEPPELVAAGRSITEPEIRDLHEAWVREVVRQLQPRWVGLASEINTLGQHGDPALYAELVSMIDGLAPEVRSLSTGAEVFVSFQVEDAHGLFIPQDGEGFGLVEDFQELDMLGLSSYPMFAFEEPADVPEDHLSRFRQETDLPLAMVEGGWSSASVPAADASPAEQAAYVARYAELLDGIDARLWILLLFADLDLDAFGLPPDRAEALESFASMGIVDSDLEPKPSFQAWEEILARPLEP